MKKKYEVRKPTFKEESLIAESLVRTNFDIDYPEGMTEERDKTRHTLHLLSNYFVMALIGYESDCPSYNGDAFIVVWGEVNFISLFTYNEDKTALVRSPADEVEIK